MVLLAERDISRTDITLTTTDALWRWVHWQYPIYRNGFACGAVLQLDSHLRWYPALFEIDGNKVKVFGHIPILFTTPEVAIDWLKSSPMEEETIAQRFIRRETGAEGLTMVSADL